MIKFGRPISVDIEARLPRLVDGLARDQDVEAVWLFGSRARGDADALSDVDIAVLARAGLSPADLFDKQLDWTTIAVGSLETDEVGVQVVNRLPVTVEVDVCFLAVRSNRYLPANLQPFQPAACAADPRPSL